MIHKSRKPMRLKNYNYAQAGYYYVTICVQNMKCLFGDVIDGKMILNECGEITNQCWKKIPEHFPHVKLDEHIMMPNHIHGIIIICRGLIYQTHNNFDDSGLIKTGMINHAPTNWMLMKNPKTTLGKIVRNFKARTTKIIHDSNTDNFNWQRSFYDHVIRNEKSLNRIREYIIYNPAQWEENEYYV